MVSEVTASRDIITTSQSTASYSEQIDAVPACSGGSVRTPLALPFPPRAGSSRPPESSERRCVFARQDQSTCEAISGCAWAPGVFSDPAGTPTCTAMVVACPAAMGPPTAGQGAVPGAAQACYTVRSLPSLALHFAHSCWRV